MIKYKGSLKDQFIDYLYWLKNLGSILKLLIKTNIRFIPAILRYPWLYQHFKAPALFKSLTTDRTGAHLHTALVLYNAVISYVVFMLINLINHKKELVLHDELIPTEIFEAMGLFYYPVDFPGLFVPIGDQHAGEIYIDATENYGVPADVCSLPSVQVGVAIRNEVPKNVLCYISTNLPCDGSSVAGAAKRRSTENTPAYQLDVPDFYLEDWADDVLSENLKDLIKFLEEKTGKKMDWDKLREVCERHNKINEVDIQAWEYSRTDNPVISGATQLIPRLIHYQSGSGSKYFYGPYMKASKIMERGFKKKEKAWKEIRFRAILWSTPPLFYMQLLEWIERAWGVTVVMDMITYTSMEFFDTRSPETMLRGLSRKYQRSIMYIQTHGGYKNNIDNLFSIADEYSADFIILANQISCRSMTALGGVFEEEARKRKIKICSFDHDLCDARTISRQQIRDSINNFMYNIMQAEPLDESLLIIDDEFSW